MNEQDQATLLTGIRHDLALHVSKDDERDKKVDKMYEIIVTGNGNPSLQERVRTLEQFRANILKLTWTVLTPLLLAIGAGIVYLIGTINTVTP